MDNNERLTSALLYFRSRKCSACTIAGYRCKSWQCNASKILAFLPDKLRVPIESKIYEIGSVQRCNFESTSCCALCREHFLLVMSKVLLKMSAEDLFMEMNGILPGDWKTSNAVWKHLIKTLDDEFIR